MNTKERSIGIVHPESYTFAEPPHELLLESGRKLGPVTIAYETYGTLNKARDNAVLVLHAFSGDAHAAGVHAKGEKPGWWDSMIGPGKAFDTDTYCVLCANIIGGCRGSTGPSSVNPATGRPYGLTFPPVTIKDMVTAQKALIDHLGIRRLLCVVGGSMGGMQVLQWVAAYPEAVAAAIPIATTLKHSPQQIAFDEVGRQAVMADPDWEHGDYYGKNPPERGLAIARMIGHITYMSDQSMEEKFSRRRTEGSAAGSFDTAFEVEGYLRYRGDTFVKRFDANSYLYITKAMDLFDLSGNRLIPAGKKIDVRFLVISFKSDWLYPSYQSQEIVKQLKMNFIDTTYCEVRSTYGHDAFLIEVEEQTHLIKHFLQKVYTQVKGGSHGK